MSHASTIFAASADAHHSHKERGSSVYARELTLAVPRSVCDIYLLHQAVWEQIDASRDGKLTDPEILYRRDGGCVSVRVGAASLKHGRSSSFAAVPGQHRRIALRCALWRDPRLYGRSPQRRLRELLNVAGFELLEHEVSFFVASGRKARIDADIQLPVADLHGTVRVLDQDKAHDAWRLGIGRGRRFGFGMLVMQD